MISTSRRRRVIPEFEPAGRSWDSRSLHPRAALGKPQGFPSGRDDGRKRRDLDGDYRAKGTSVDFVSDKPFLGKGTYDSLGADVGGGGRYGSTCKGRDSVHRALDWLTRHRNAEGSWSRSGGTACAQERCSTQSEPGDEFATALALQAFLGAGYSDLSKDTWDGVGFGDVIGAAARWLVSRQARDGVIGKGRMTHLVSVIALLDLRHRSKAGVYTREIQRALDAIGSPVGFTEVERTLAVMVAESAALEAGAEIRLPEPLTPLLSALKARDEARRMAEGLVGTESPMELDAYVRLASFSRAEGWTPQWEAFAALLKVRIEAGQAEDKTGCRAGRWDPGSESSAVIQSALRSLCLELCPPYHAAPWGER